MELERELDDASPVGRGAAEGAWRSLGGRVVRGRKEVVMVGEVYVLRLVPDRGTGTTLDTQVCSRNWRLCFSFISFHFIAFLF